MWIPISPNLTAVLLLYYSYTSGFILWRNRHRYADNFCIPSVSNAHDFWQAQENQINGYIASLNWNRWSVANMRMIKKTKIRAPLTGFVVSEKTQFDRQSPSWITNVAMLLLLLVFFKLSRNFQNTLGSSFRSTASFTRSDSESLMSRRMSRLVFYHEKKR